MAQSNLTSGRNLARNVLWNIMGTGAPLLVAIITIPILIEGLGTARFGVLTLAWMVVGYFSLFDLGLGRALTKLVAEKLGAGLDNEVPPLVWTAMLIMVAFGVLGAVVISILSPWLVGSVLKIPLELQSETLTSFYLLAASVPVVIGSTGLRGILEAHQRFGLVNVVRVSLGIFTFLGPVMVLPFSSSLVPVVAVLVIARLVSWFAYAAMCLRVEPKLRQTTGIHRAMVKPLIKFGGWMTVTNIISPLMVYMDRFLIGGMVSMTAVAYYATPYAIVTKLSIVPAGIMGVMFPAFAAALMEGSKRAALLFDRTVKYLFLCLYPAVLIIVTLANEGLTLWLGSEFATNSTLVLQLLTVGIFINSLAYVPSGLIESAGRPDLTAKLHMAELPIYLLILWWMLDTYGIVGAAIAWVLRMVIDIIFLSIIAHRLLSTVTLFSLRSILISGITLCTLVLGAMIPELAMKYLFLGIILLVFMAATWLFTLSSDEKSIVRRCLKVC